MSGKPDEFLRMGTSGGSVPGGFVPYSSSKKARAKTSHDTSRYDANGMLIDYSESFTNSSDADLLQEDDPNGTYYPIEALQEKSIPDLNYEHLENYLSAQDFKEALGVTKTEFQALPKWKQTKAKKAAKLF